MLQPNKAHALVMWVGKGTEGPRSLKTVTGDKTHPRLATQHVFNKVHYYWHVGALALQLVSMLLSTLKSWEGTKPDKGKLSCITRLTQRAVHSRTQPKLCITQGMSGCVSHLCDETDMNSPHAMLSAPPTSPAKPARTKACS